MFSEGRNKIGKIKEIDLDAAFTKAASDPTFQSQMIDLNKKQLYEDGVEADGAEIGEYAPSTISRKTREGDAVSGVPGRVDHITLNDKGDFYDSIKVEQDGNTLVITGDSPSYDFDQSFPKPLGLTEESISELSPELSDRMLDEIKNQL